ncbi:NifU family protein [Oecophyllibacter saccharovorans]|uniref:NifU family protein n=1 Tax=Oecophyllibacter saccharovorans TaxID=2558360 RepID=UPI0011446EA7|nr:NifU family protein [Oecophyllibacter saccharovorans]QDH15291.1 NifU family protein [Oecophyllibacter saccharovorans]
MTDTSFTTSSGPAAAPPVVIAIEETPNPATLKFLPGRSVTGNQDPVDFTSPEAAQGRSTLAGLLFTLPEIQRVFLGHDFVAVTKEDHVDWAELSPVVLGVLTDFFESGEPALQGARESLATEEKLIMPIQEADAETVRQVRDLLDTRIRPAVAADGGDIVFRGFRDGMVYLSMRGACSGCPSSRATLRHGVENMLRHYVPEVVGVEQVEA